MNVLTSDQLRTAAPSIFAAQAWDRMSPRYRFARTADVVEMLGDRGFLPVRAQQGKCRLPGKSDFTRHLIRFRREGDLDAGLAAEIPELVLTNAHDGTSAYRFEAGIFRVACTNGLVVKSSEFGSISVRHSGGDDFYRRIIDATHQIADAMPSVLSTVNTWKQIELTPGQRDAYAAAAFELKPSEAIRPSQLLEARRTEDAKPDLWHTFNRVQENTLKGEIAGRNERGRRVRTRPIKGVEADLKLNRALWVLAEKLAETIA